MAFPTFATTAVTERSFEGGASLGAANAVALPTSAALGDLIIVCAAQDGPGTTAMTSSWGTDARRFHEFATSNARKLAIWARVITGSGDAPTFTAQVNDDYIILMQRIPAGTHDVLNNTAGELGKIKISASAQSTTLVLDTPSLDAGAVADWLWISAGCLDLSTDAPVTLAPTNYSGLFTSGSGTDGVDISAAMAFRALNAQVENPGAFTNPSNDWFGVTIAIPPVAGVLTLSVADVVHVHPIDAVALTQDHTLTGVADVDHVHLVDVTVLTSDHTLTGVADVLHAHEAEAVILNTSETLTNVADVLHAHEAEAVTLTSDHTLVVAEALHVHPIENVDLVQNSSLTGVADVLHAHEVEAVVLTTGADPTVTAVSYFTVGAVEPTAAKMTAQLTVSGVPVIQVSTSADLSSPMPFTGSVVGIASLYRFVMTGLPSDTLLHWGFNGIKHGQFRTAPVGAKSFKVVGGSCWDSGTTITWSRMLAKAPAFVMVLGDFPYTDNTTASEANYLSSWDSALSNSVIKSLCASCMWTYSWSDHDYGANNGDGSASYRTFAQSAFRKVFSTYPMDGTDGEIYHTWSWGRVRFFNLDCFSERSPEGNTDNSSKTMLGTWQKAQFKADLLAATEPILVVNMEEPWIIGGGELNGWDIYGTERAELGTFFTANDLNDRMIIVHGDGHQLAYDDGTHSRYGTGSGLGPKLACWAPINNTNSAKGGPYTIGPIQAETTQYGELDFADTGGATITVTMRGWSVQSAGAETLEFEEAHVFDAVTVTNLVVQDVVHAHSVEPVALAQTHILTVADTLHAHAVEPTVLTQVHELVVADAEHSHLADNVVLTQLHQLVVDDALHLHLADHVPITMETALTGVADVLHAHLVEAVTLSGAANLVLSPVMHSHLVDAVTLTQIHTLAVQDATHTHLAASAVLTQLHQLVVADGLHAHLVPNIALSGVASLTVENVVHDHLVDALVLTQLHFLVVADALHLHTVGAVVLGQPGVSGGAKIGTNEIVGGFMGVLPVVAVYRGTELVWSEA